MPLLRSRAFDDGAKRARRAEEQRKVEETLREALAAAVRAAIPKRDVS